MKIAVITLGDGGRLVASAVAARHPESVELRRGRDGELADIFARAFAEERDIVCAMAAGIATRMAAPLLRGKFEDPALVVVDEAARFAISLVSGHEGGANRLAYEVAAATGAEPVVTTGSETARRFTLGVGCRLGAASAAIEAAILSLLDGQGLEPCDVRVAASIRRKSAEPGLIQALDSLDIPALFLREEDVAATAKAADLEPSAAARHGLGVPSVAEPCALLAARSGVLRVRKRRFDGGVTLALAEEKALVQAAEDTTPVVRRTGGRGRLSIVGIGPGSLEMLTGDARRALVKADFVAGYGPYLELVAPLLRGKELFSSPMTMESERARRALDEALSGRRVALVASGDACVYGIGGVALCQASEAELEAIDVEIHPGVTAANAAAALVGSPFEDDYAVISLSDILTPKDRIISRLKAVAGAGLAVALYNPRSGARKDLFRRAVEAFLESRPPTTPAAVVGDAWRPAQRAIVCTLETLMDHEEEVDMTSVVLIGSPAARKKAGLIVEPRGAGSRDSAKVGGAGTSVSAENGGGA